MKTKIIIIIFGIIGGGIIYGNLEQIYDGLFDFVDKVQIDSIDNEQGQISFLYSDSDEVLVSDKSHIFSTAKEIGVGNTAFIGYNIENDSIAIQNLARYEDALLQHQKRNRIIFNVGLWVFALLIGIIAVWLTLPIVNWTLKGLIEERNIKSL